MVWRKSLFNTLNRLGLTVGWTSVSDGQTDKKDGRTTDRHFLRYVARPIKVFAGQ